MAKLIYCQECGHIENLKSSGGVTRCDCLTGPVVGWWVDEDTGLAQMAVLPPGDPAKARVIVIHTGFLRADIEQFPAGYMGPDGRTIPFSPVEIDTLWREAHDELIDLPPRPEALSIFSPGRRACVLAEQIPGTTPDTHWAQEPELLRRGLLEVTRA
jgi:hypothetical protein